MIVNRGLHKPSGLPFSDVRFCLREAKDCVAIGALPESKAGSSTDRSRHQALALPAIEDRDLCACVAPLAEDRRCTFYYQTDCQKGAKAQVCKATMYFLIARGGNITLMQPSKESAVLPVPSQSLAF